MFVCFYIIVIYKYFKLDTLLNVVFIFYTISVVNKLAYR